METKKQAFVQNVKRHIQKSGNKKTSFRTKRKKQFQEDKEVKN